MLTYHQQVLDWTFEITNQNYMRIQGGHIDAVIFLPPDVALPLVENLMGVMRINENLEALDK